jgi:N-acetylglutamate synthase-like GNAT family acetyltransferase
MQEIVIRDLALEDLLGETGDSFFRCLVEIVGAASFPIVASQSDLIDIFYLRQHAGIITLVATLNKSIIGTASMIIESKFIHGNKKVAHIEDVAVIDDYQYTGIGRTLIEELIRTAKANNCYKIILDCKDKVSGFYSKLGFKMVDNNNMRMDLPNSCIP